MLLLAGLAVPALARLWTYADVRGRSYIVNNCIDESVRVMDDGRSDAVTIAEAALDACKRPVNEVMSLLNEGGDQTKDQQFRSGIEKVFRSYAIRQVLTQRRVRAEYESGRKP